MFHKPADEITAADIERLVTEGVEEGPTIDFKATLPGNSSADRKELAADASSFANARGGYIVFGVEESEGVAADVVGLAGVNVDDEILRLESRVRDTIAPRIPGVRVVHVRDLDSGPVLVMHVPKSWTGPHMVSLGDSRFYARGNRGKHQLDVMQIRDAFLGAREIPAMLRRLRDERLAMIQDGDAPVDLGGKLHVVTHVMPVAMLMSREGVDPRLWKEHIHRVGGGGYGFSHFNAHGYAATGAKHEEKGHGAYTQGFRNGVLEFVDQLHAWEDETFSPSHVQNSAVQGIEWFAKVAGPVGIEGPTTFFLSLVGCRGWTRVDRSARPWLTPVRISTDVLCLPDVTFEPAELHDRGAVLRALRGTFDTLWQAVGSEGSPNFDKDGNWREVR